MLDPAVRAVPHDRGQAQGERGGQPGSQAHQAAQLRPEGRRGDQKSSCQGEINVDINNVVDKVMFLNKVLNNIFVVTKIYVFSIRF